MDDMLSVVFSMAMKISTVSREALTRKNGGYLPNAVDCRCLDRFDRGIDPVHRKILRLSMNYVDLPENGIE